MNQLLRVHIYVVILVAAGIYKRNFIHIEPQRQASLDKKGKIYI